MSHTIQEYVRRSAAFGRDTERAGPFLATFTPHSANPYLNYAIPDTGARPSPGDVAALVDAYRRHDRVPRLEYLPGVAPAVEPALLAAGFTVEGRFPLMAGTAAEVVAKPVPDGLDMLVPVTDAELHAMLSALNEAYDEAEPPGDADVARMRNRLAAGGLATLVRDAATGEPAGGGLCDVISDGVGELAGFGVRRAYRRRGIAAAITYRLSVEAFAAGAETVFLTPGGDTARRVYERAGLRTVDEVLHIRRD